MLATSAVLTLLFTSAAMASELDQEYPVQTTVSSQPMNYCDSYSQTFTVGKLGQLDKLSLYMMRSGAAGITWVAIYSVDPETGEPNTDSPWSSDEEPLSSQEIPYTSIATSEFQWTDILLDKPVSVGPGERYAIVLWRTTEFQSCSDATSITWGRDGSSLDGDYPGGESWYVHKERPGQWTHGSDQYFRTYVTPDTTAPTGTVLINNGDLRTSTRLVTLSLSATDPEPGSGVSQMRFKNRGTDTVWSAWQPYKSGRSWYLTPGEGTKRVAAQFKDAAGNRSAPVYDYIIFRR